MDNEEEYENEDEISINSTIYSKEKSIYIEEENSSGCEYSYNTLDELYDAFRNYIQDYVQDRIELDLKNSKNIVKLTDDEMIRFYANKIVEDGLNKCSEFNYCIGMDEYEDSNFIFKHKEQILDRITKDERVSEVHIDEDNNTFDMCYWLDYCPHYYEINHLSTEEEIEFLQLFIEKSLNPIAENIISNTTWYLMRNFMDEYIEPNENISFEMKDDIYFSIKEHICNTGFNEKYLDICEVYIDKNNINELIEGLEKEIEILEEENEEER